MTNDGATILEKMDVNHQAGPGPALSEECLVLRLSALDVS